MCLGHEVHVQLNHIYMEQADMQIRGGRGLENTADVKLRKSEIASLQLPEVSHLRAHSRCS